MNSFVILIYKDKRNRKGHTQALTMAAKWGRKEKTQAKKASTTEGGSASKSDAKVVIVGSPSRVKRLSQAATSTRTRKVVSGLLFVLALLVVAGVVWTVFFADEPEQIIESRKVCHEGSSAYKEGANYLRYADYEKAAVLVTDIKNDPNHENDKNCLYIIVATGVLHTDIEETQKYFAKLQGVMKAEDTLDPAFAILEVQKLTDVQRQVDALNEGIKINSESTILFN